MPAPELITIVHDGVANSARVPPAAALVLITLYGWQLADPNDAQYLPSPPSQGGQLDVITRDELDTAVDEIRTDLLTNFARQIADDEGYDDTIHQAVVDVATNGVGAATDGAMTLAVRRAARAAGARLAANYDANAAQIVNVTPGALSTSTLIEPTFAVTATNSDDVFTTPTAHGLVVGERVRIANKTGGAFINGLAYFVRSVPSTTTFTLFAGNGSSGGIADIGSDITAATLYTKLATQEFAWSRGWGAATITAAGDLWTTTVPHRFIVGDGFQVTSSTAGGVVDNTKYYVLTTPTPTTFTVSATVGGPTLDVTGDGTASLNRANPRYQILEGRPQQSTNGAPQWDVAKWDLATISIGSGNGTIPGSCLAPSVNCYDSVVEGVFLNDNSSSHQVFVDGVLIDEITAAQLSAAGIGSGSFGFKLYPFATPAARRLLIRSNIAVGWRCTPAGMFSRPVINPGAMWYWVGDSFGEGMGRNIPWWVAQFLGVRDMRVVGAGTVGYLANGNRQAISTRVQTDVIRHRPGRVTYAAGINDPSDTLSQRNAAVAAAITTWEQTATAGIAFDIIGPFPENGGAAPTAGKVAYDLQLSNEAASRGFRYLSSIQEGITFTRSDATHPDGPGHRTLGTWAAGHLAVPHLATLG